MFVCWLFVSVWVLLLVCLFGELFTLCLVSYCLWFVICLLALFCLRVSFWLLLICCLFCWFCLRFTLFV